MRWLLNSFVGGFLLFGAFSASQTYDLNSYSIGPGGTSGAASSTYHTQAAGGEAAGSGASSTLSGNTGGVQTEQLNTPGAPVLSNGSNMYYNKLQLAISPGSLPSDSTYAVAVSTNNFSTTSYVQSDGTLGGSQVYQSYAAWGGASGTYIVGLAPSTTYEGKVAAMQGQFTNTAFGPVASATTASPTLGFSLSPNSLSLGSLLAGAITSGPAVTLTLSTNATSGGTVFVAGQYNGLFSPNKSYTIPALSGDLSVAAQGFGLQSSSATQTSGGPFTAASPYNGSGTVVGTETSSYGPLYTSTAPVTGGLASLLLRGKASSTTPSSGDYQEVLTFVAVASF